MSGPERSNTHQSLEFPPDQVRERLASADPELAKTWSAVVDFAQEIVRAGGRAYLVGGAVRDQVLGW